jgi:hypothetical protein
MPVRVLEGELIEDRTDAWSAVLSTQSDLGGRDLGMEIERRNRGLVLRIYPSAPLADKFDEFEVPLRLTDAQLSKEVIDCQAVWWKEIVERRDLLHRYPFHITAENPVKEKEYRERVLRRLAEAGEQLFQQVFQPAGPEFKATRKVGETLCTLMQQPDIWIRIRSRNFVVPWNFMYPGDSDTPNPAGFWGCQHLIEHDVSQGSSASNAPFSPNLRIAAHFDERIDVDSGLAKFRCIQSFRDLLGGYGLVPKERNTRSDFSGALRNCADEHIFYFCCHARAGKRAELSFDPQRLFLTNPDTPEAKESIEPSHIDVWLRRCDVLPGRPLVFINACEAAKAGSIFYEGFPARFLDHAASAVVGPELEMPVIFAREFAGRFFTDFFRGGPENSVGKILLRWRRKYLNEFRNPLGLAYSLYRGGDVALDAPLVLSRTPRGSASGAT